MESKLTVAMVNKAIKAAGGVEKLRAGRGYYYFEMGPGKAPSSMITVYRVDMLDLNRWMRELEEKRREAE